MRPQSRPQPLHELRPYQIEGVKHLVEHPRAWLADDAGLGKSIQAIRAADHLKADKLLIVCPAIGRVSWAKELAQQTHPRAVHVVANPKTFKAPASGPLAVVVTYDTLGLKTNKAFRAELRKLSFDVIVLDEAHYLKNAGANRTRAVYGAGGLLDANPNARLWVMSATLAPNHAGEVWTHAARGWRITDRTQHQWEDRYCYVDSHPTYGRRVTGTRRDPALVTELRDLIAPIMLRRRKSEVLTELPPLEFFDEHIDVEDLSHVDLNLPPDITDEELLAYLQNKQTHLATMRRAIGLAKTNAAAEWARELLEGGLKKLVLFGVHQDVLDKLNVLLRDFHPVQIDGRTTPQARVRAVDTFQMDPTCRVFIGNIQAAGTAITLTAASTVGIVEPSWVPAENYQAASRCHRFGQRDGVQCHFLAAAGTLDVIIIRAFRRKAAEIAAIFE